MEKIEQVFYFPIKPSDFKKMYDLDRPDTGGGQTYIDIARINDDELADFLIYAEMDDPSSNKENRPTYTIHCHTLGTRPKAILSNDYTRTFIEFAPRAGRNFRISRQNIANKHPAWSPENDFPEPEKDKQGNYCSSDSFSGIIDYLKIIIIRTTYRKYYASFINTQSMPDSWPKNIGLDHIFTNVPGILKFGQHDIIFNNDKDNPFKIESEVQPVNNGINIIYYGVPGSGKSYIVEKKYCKPSAFVTRIVFHPDYTNADFIGQLEPTLDQNDQLVYEFSPGPFTQAIKSAYHDPGQEHFLIIEEINRGNAQAIFAEAFQLLDRCTEDITDNNKNLVLLKGTSKYDISHIEMARYIYGDPAHKIRIPSNLAIIATMNTSDQNTFTLDTAFQRRWIMKLVNNSFENGDQLASADILDTNVKWDHFRTTINDIIIDSDNTITSSTEDKRLGTHFVLMENLQVKTNDTNDFIGCFAEKVIKYLWDDVFKFNRNTLFNNQTFKTLEEVINHFENTSGNERFNIFNESVRLRLFDQNPEQ